MKKILLYLLLISTLITAREGEGEELSYSITKDDTLMHIKRSVEIILSQKVSKVKLEKLAKIIKNKDANKYERTFIGYYIDDSSPKNTYWATTHYNPNLEINILGSTIKEDKKLQDSRKPQGNVLGIWMDDRQFINQKVTIFKKNKKMYVQITYKSGKSETSQVQYKQTKNGIKVITDSETKQFYIIKKDGRLFFWESGYNYHIANTIN